MDAASTPCAGVASSGLCMADDAGAAIGRWLCRLNVEVGFSGKIGVTPSGRAVSIGDREGSGGGVLGDGAIAGFPMAWSGRFVDESHPIKGERR